MISTFEDILEKDGRLVYTNVGTSMMPLLRQRRDLMVIEKKGPERLHWLDVPLFKRDNGQYVLHRVMWVRKNDYVLCGDNQWYLERGITDKHILGVLTQVDRDGKRLDMRSTKMRLYGLFQWLIYPLRATLLLARYTPGAIYRRLFKRNVRRHATT
ncbi:MAG: hypothetical protein IKN59_01095 [Paludibacteraceae bacterium]|nr:hypothetical protein [Paludibacteraceae bacterium]